MHEEMEEWVLMVEDCQVRASKMSDWESGFMDSIAEQLDDDRPLSVLQSDKLNEIWDRVTANG